MIQKLKAFWASLPHPVQAMIIGAGTAVGTSFLHSLSEGCFTAACLKHSALTSLAAGLAVVKAFYMLPNGNAQLVAQAKAENAAK